MVVAVDAMGGDFAPDAVLDGALLAAGQGASICLFGDKKQLELLLDQRDAAWRTHSITLADAPECIAMDDEPVTSVRTKTQSSLVQAVQSVKDGRCQAVLSAGNSGALMAAALLLLGRQKGVKRPAIAGFVPSSKGAVLMLDMGANTECRAEHLAEFAVMGDRYAREHLGNSSPTVALLSNGHESGKGSQVTKEAFRLISQNSMINFLGNIEPYGIMNGDADVVVTDGFSGNILLKTMESTYSYFKSEFRRACRQNGDLEKSGVPFMRSIAQKADVREQGGACLLGVNGQVTVCHGNADSFAIKQAIVRLSGVMNASGESKDKDRASLR